MAEEKGRNEKFLVEFLHQTRRNIIGYQIWSYGNISDLPCQNYDIP